MRLGDVGGSETPPLTLQGTWRGLQGGGRIRPLSAWAEGRQGQFLTPGWRTVVAVPCSSQLQGREKRINLNIQLHKQHHKKKKKSHPFAEKD